MRALTDRREKKSNGKPPNQTPAWRWLVQQFFSLVRQFGNTIIWATVCIYLIYQLGATLRSFAGTTSVANLLLSIAGHVSITVTVSMAFTLTMTGMYLLEYRRHRSTRERLTKRITQLELQIDPNRTSSGISTQGTTRIGDQ